MDDINLEDEFNKWLYENFTICNGDQLIGHLENPIRESQFLRDMGLPEETEIFR
jgi:hypothetical protein